MSKFFHWLIFKVDLHNKDPQKNPSPLARSVEKLSQHENGTGHPLYIHTTPTLEEL